MAEDTEKKTFADSMDEIGATLKGANDAIADTVVGGYTAIEEGVVGAYKKVENAFVDTFLRHSGETVEEAKARLAAEQEARKAEAEGE